MAKVTIEVDEELAKLILAAEKKLEEQAKAAKEFAPLDIEGTQAVLRETTNSVGKDLQRRWLQSLDTDEAAVVIGGKRCAKVGRYETTFRTLEGPVKVTRTLLSLVPTENLKRDVTISRATRKPALMSEGQPNAEREGYDEGGDRDQLDDVDEPERHRAREQTHVDRREADSHRDEPTTRRDGSNDDAGRRGPRAPGLGRRTEARWCGARARP